MNPQEAQPLQSKPENKMVDNDSQTANLNCTEDIDPESEPLIIYGMDFGTTDYHDAYRNGNFGLKRGRIDFTRAKRWSRTHLVVAVLVAVLSISAVSLMGGQHRYWIDRDTVDAFSGINISCGLLAVITSCCSLYLVTYVTTMRRPLFVLLLVRLLSVLECMLAIAGIVTTLIAVSDSHERDPWIEYRHYWTTQYPGQVWKSEHFGLFIFLCVFLVIAMIVDFITAGAWLFHWWRCCNCCQKFKSVCIFEPGQPLAEGIPDPRTGFCRECMFVCWAAYRADCGTII